MLKSMHTQQINAMYQALLADVQRLTGVSLTPPLIDDEWITIGGPKLDKSILRWIEVGGEFPQAPEWIKPLCDLFLNKKEATVYRHLRTLLNFGYKVEYEPTPQQIAEAEKAFVDVEEGIKVWDDSHEPARSPFYRRVRTLIHRVLKRATMGKFAAATPFHGPGSVFPTQKPWNKGCFQTEYTSLARYYPWDTFFQGVFVEDLLENAKPGDTVDRIVCSMVAVPKDARGPRLICVHPAEVIWIQQSQRTVIEREIMRSPYTSGKISFRDQTINGRLALSSSLDRKFCTLDLKEASDRLSKKLVDYLLGDHADILGCSRASHVRLLSGRVIELQKWAPMGNCNTFPVESLIFWALVHTAISSSVDCTRGNPDAVNPAVYVFGDDILFPSQYHSVVIERLCSSGLVPNELKTFYRGFFRESCGVDAFTGVDVTPLRTKVAGCVSYSSAESLCALARNCQIRGYSALAACIYDDIQVWLNTKNKNRRRNPLRLVPSNNPNTQGIYRYVPMTRGELIVHLASMDESQLIRYNSKYQYFETRYIRLAPRKRKPSGARWHLVESLVNLERGGPSDRGLEYVVPDCIQPQSGWTYIED